MLTFVFEPIRLLNPNTISLSLSSFTPNLHFIQVKSHTDTFSSLNLFCSSKSKPNSVLFDEKTKQSDQIKPLFKSYGFTVTQISKLLHAQPQFLSANPRKSVAPKIEFLRSIGISNTHIVNIVLANPCILTRSLHNQLIPCIKFLKSLLIHDDDVVKLLRKSWTMQSMLDRNIQREIAPNIALLTEVGVPKSRIGYMLVNHPSGVFQIHDKLKRIVEEVISMGFNPVNLTFVLAIDVLCRLKKTTIDRKWEVYRRWGLSDDDILMTFRRQPICMSLSEEKITRTMDFLVNEMGWQAAKISRNPVVLFLSLENRIIPRCRVIQLLISKGILEKDSAFGGFLIPSDTKFIENFVSKYNNKVPELLNIYRGKKGPMQTGLDQII